jgi:hypothetical protein
LPAASEREYEPCAFFAECLDTGYWEAATGGCLVLLRHRHS